MDTVEINKSVFAVKGTLTMHRLYILKAISLGWNISQQLRYDVNITDNMMDNLILFMNNTNERPKEMVYEFFNKGVPIFHEYDPVIILDLRLTYEKRMAIKLLEMETGTKVLDN